ncbi:MAG: aconitase/3-isopropylmalate dehydratase large subunit family protein [Candidatus Aminicenantes bacterium]|nr:aconitase/3-isopropylmalate dehydratase large subunit family protein [Candidatus Aminicenantes bacterium]MDH5741959.1 aconitase/3-isopropylmalate dehydratase large subunit family protein [Candidatus Aminicenantes bacterium]
MGKTIVEKIIQSHTQEEARAGSIVWVDLDVRSARDFGGPNVVLNYKREYGDVPVDDKEKTFFTFDLCVPACSLKYADNQQICREFARKQGIRIFDVDRGIGSHVLIEEGLALPGTTVVGTDSHLNILGAVGCFGQGMGDVDITFAFRTGKMWFEVPATLKVLIDGQVSWPATPKDLILYILKILGTEKASLKAVEFYGEAVNTLPLAGRITLCSMITEMAGIIGFVPETNSFLREEMRILTQEDFSSIEADVDATYVDEVKINIDGLTPQVAAPFSPENVFAVDELKGTRIDSGFIGSCTNGRTEDFAAAVRILKGRRVKEGVMLKVVPSTRQVYQELLQQGLLEDLFASGAIISNPGCGGCAEGHIGLTGEGEIQISTGNRNFAGKQGKGKTYLASPEVVAASCVLGSIANPKDV